MTRCLLVDDDPAIRTLLLDYLQSFGFEVEALPDGASLRRRLTASRFDVLLLDLMLPDDDGLALCPWAKQQCPSLPIIMLTAQGDPLSRVLGLELGADDYLPKPFEPRELVARIRAVLRRGQALTAGPASPTAAVLRFAGWTFDRLKHQLQAPDGTIVPLSTAEFRLLSAFAEHPGQVLGRERLLDLSRAPGTAGTERSIDLAVSRLRGKLVHPGGAPMIRTVRGEGYRFDTPVEGGR
ncbi:response regulator transcription factor [Ideonella sp. DXS29W]|uniref:Response regulator transcription factor n=1 Tax=Ideonella lacteola TaxID=2984193 RepID=A0ABU9BMZ9_9BURK